MRRFILASTVVFACAFAIGSWAAPLAAQAPAARATKTSADKTWTPPRTPWGAPDVQGTWANNNATPFERPKELEGRQFLTAEEVAALKAKAGELFNGETDAAFGDAVFKAALAGTLGKSVDVKAVNGFDVVTGNYNQFWLVDREFDNRTSVITDPADGRVPPLTLEAQKRQAAAAEYRRSHPADGPEDLPLGHRCVNFGVPKIGAGYNSYHHILQTPDHVVIFSEMAHDARIIPLDGRPHLNQNLRQWNGDARGRWEGNTLIVQTTNFSRNSEFRGSRENLRLTERFTRVGPNALRYEFTVEDPTTWTKPWGGMIPLKSSNEPIFEYACHEGNEGLAGALSGYRTQEQTDAESAKRKSR